MLLALLKPLHQPQIARLGLRKNDASYQLNEGTRIKAAGILSRYLTQVLARARSTGSASNMGVCLAGVVQALKPGEPQSNPDNSVTLTPIFGDKIMPHGQLSS